MNFDLHLIGLWQVIATLVAVALLATAAWCDLLARIIPDWISVALAAAGLMQRLTLGLGAAATSIGLAALLFLALVIAHARGGLGGGDVKLMSALAIGLSPYGLYQMLICTAFAGGILAVVHFVCRRLPRPEMQPRGASRAARFLTIEKWRWRRPNSLPYGIAIACGGAWALLSGTGT